jgi:hypothetical protein
VKGSVAVSHWNLLAATCVGVTLMAQPALAATAQPGVEHSIGFYGSNMCGSGLTYSLHVPSGQGLHVSAIGWSVPGNTWYNIGGALTQDIAQPDWGRVYALVAGGVALGNNAWVPNIAPGVGVDWGGLYAEFGYSFFPNQAAVGAPLGLSSVPAFGVGVRWKI